MMTTICFLVLIYLMMGKDVNRLLEKLKGTDWLGKINDLMDKLRPWALKAGRMATKPLLCLYYVLEDENTSTLDRALIYAAILYTISPVNLLPTAVYKLLGILDEGAAILFVYNKVKDKITPEINIRVENTLIKWFGAEYEIIKE